MKVRALINQVIESTQMDLPGFGEAPRIEPPRRELPQRRPVTRHIINFRWNGRDQRLTRDVGPLENKTRDGVVTKALASFLLGNKVRPQDIPIEISKIRRGDFYRVRTELH